MKKVLFLTPEMPWPPYSGGRIKSFNLIKYLAKNYSLSVGSLLKGNDIDHVEEFSDAINLTNLFTSPINVKRTVMNFAKSIVKRIPLNVLRNQDKKFAELVRDQVEHCDTIFVDHYEMMQYVPANFTGTVILHQHNAYYVLWERFAEQGSGLIKRGAALFESRRVKKWERNCCERADLVFAAPNDIDMLARIGVDKDKMAPTLHLGDESHITKPDLSWSNTDLSILYVGHLGWEPNVQGLQWFIKNVWPELKQSFPTLILNIIGANPDPRLLDVAAGDANILFEGFQKDLEPWMTSCRVMIAPLLVGSGIKVKVLTAMARGIPLATTQTGVEGLQVSNFKELTIAKDASEMVDNIHTTLSNRLVWERLARESRRTIRDRYTWKHVFDSMQSRMDLLETGKLIPNPNVHNPQVRSVAVVTS